MSLYRSIFKQALSISWKNKYLWFFGLFAALLGNGGDYEIISRFLVTDDSGFGLARILQTGVFSDRALMGIADFMTAEPFSFALSIFVGLFILVIIGTLIWLANISQAALVDGSVALTAGKQVKLKHGIVVGTEHFWPVLGLNLLNKVLVSLVFIVIALPLGLSINASSSMLANLLYFIAFIILVPAVILLSFVIKYAIAFKVIKNYDLHISLMRAWKLFVENWLVSVEMAFILFFINLIYGLVVLILLAVLAVPLLFLALIFYYMTSFVGFWLVATFAMVLFFVLIVLAGSYLAVFQVISWTSLYLELTGRGATAKIVRILKNYV